MAINRTSFSNALWSNHKRARERYISSHGPFAGLDTWNNSALMKTFLPLTTNQDGTYKKLNLYYTYDWVDFANYDICSFESIEEKLINEHANNRDLLTSNNQSYLIQNLDITDTDSIQFMAYLVDLPPQEEREFRNNPIDFVTNVKEKMAEQYNEQGYVLNEALSWAYSNQSNYEDTLVYTSKKYNVVILVMLRTGSSVYRMTHKLIGSLPIFVKETAAEDFDLVMSDKYYERIFNGLFDELDRMFNLWFNKVVQIPYKELHKEKIKADLTEGLEQNSIAAMQHKITEQKNKISQMEQNLTTEYNELKRLSLQMLSGVTTNPDELYNFLMRCPYIKEIQILRSELTLFIVSPLEIIDNVSARSIWNRAGSAFHRDLDTDYADRHPEHSMENMFKYLFITKQVVLNTYSKIKINLRTKEVFATSDTPSSVDFKEAANRAIKQPHIMRHNCFGNTRTQIVNCMQRGDILPAIGYIINATQNFNLGDSTVFENVRSELNTLRRHSHIKAFQIKGDDTHYSYVEVCDKLKQEATDG